MNEHKSLKLIIPLIEKIEDMSSLKGKNGNGNKNKINREFLEKKWPILIKYPNIEILKEKIRAKSKDRKRKSYIFVQSTPLNRKHITSRKYDKVIRPRIQIENYR